MRCPNCERFVSREARAEWDTEPEIIYEVIQASVRLILVCADCEEELAEAVVELEEPVKPDTVEFDEVLAEDLQVQDAYIGSDKDGKPYPARYQKHIYWVDFELACYDKDGKVELVNFSTDPVQASYFEQLF